MAIINTERFVTILTNSQPMRERAFYPARQGIREQLSYAVGIPAERLRGEINRESALAMLGQVRDYVAQNGWLNGKYLRPWDIDDQLYANLDRNEPWWGFEFETGWDSVEARADAIRHTWDSWDNVVFDTEGEGRAAVEITFAPCEVSKYKDGTAAAYQFSQYLCASEQTYNGGAEGVGTHINISHPLMDHSSKTAAIVMALNRTIAHLPKMDGGVDVRKKYFGRSNLYGGFFVGQGTAQWVEGKLFRTTYDFDQFQIYVKTSEVLTKCIEAMLTVGMKTETDRITPFVTNMYEMLTSGADPIVEWTQAIECDGTRGNGRLNGQLARDNYTPRILTPEETINIPDDVRYVHAYADLDGFYDDYDDDYEEDDDEDIGGMWCDICEDYH